MANKLETEKQTDKIDDNFSLPHASLNRTRSTLEICAHTSLAICCLARDCASLIKKNIRRLEKLASHFAHVEFFVVENDSKDNSREVLARWQKKSRFSIHLPDVYAYLEGLAHVEIDFDRSSDAQSFVGIYESRVKRISLGRDCYLDALKTSNFVPEYVLMFDMDTYNFSIAGILESLLAGTGATRVDTKTATQAAQHTHLEWDILTANGLMYYYKGFKCHTLYYDSFAVEKFGEKSKARNINIHLQQEMTELLAQEEYVRANSAFGGMGLYRYNAIFAEPETSYLSSIEMDSHQFCEHISFHRYVREKGYDKLFISRSMCYYYNTKLRAFIKQVLKKLKLR